MAVAGMSRICDNYRGNGFGTPDGVRRLRLKEITLSSKKHAHQTAGGANT